MTKDQFPSLKISLVVPASMSDDHARTDLCVYLPEQSTKLTVARHPLVPEAGLLGPLWMTIAPYVSTAHPYIERMNVIGAVGLSIPQLSHETLFSFENSIYPRQPSLPIVGETRETK